MNVDVSMFPEHIQKQILRKVREQEGARKGPESPKRSKYGNVKTEIDGRLFDSKAEARRYEELKLLQKSGEIHGFICQISIPLFTRRYVADFLVWGASGELWLEDVKGMETDVFRLKKSEVEKLYPWLELRIVKR